MTDKIPKPGSIVRGTLFPEPVQVIVCVPLGEPIKLVGKGLDSGRVYEAILDAGQVGSEMDGSVNSAKRDSQE